MSDPMHSGIAVFFGLLRVFVGFCSILLVVTAARAGEKVSGQLEGILDLLGPHDELGVWVFFTDKGVFEAQRNAIPLDVVSGRSLQRRSKVRQHRSLVDYSDLPVDQAYLDGIGARVVKIRQRSKWFNAVSAVATKEQIAALQDLPYVRGIDLLARYRRTPTESEEADGPKEGPQPVYQYPTVYDSAAYGVSFSQVNQINVPAVHNSGNFGQGIIVGVFDNGFRLLTHETFDSLDIIATYDFVDHKVSVVPVNPSAAFGSHGVNTLSTIAGFTPGSLIGPAFGASYILARTENDSSETPIEEDNWVAAIEWADSIGVEVTSTSLGYLDYEPPYSGWTWEDMDGNTTVITRAADMAVGRGIIVVNSAGNAGFDASHNTLIAPADGDSVLAVGAVTSTGARSSFSSVGPTTSVPPRIKPDVMARGSSVRVASATNPAGYGSASGTSFSCPLAAGVAALILHASPGSTPVQIINAMRSTASEAATPDNLHGWGILNARSAINQLTRPSLVAPPNGVAGQDTQLTLVWTSVSGALSYRLQMSTDSLFTSTILDDSTLADTTRQVVGLQGLTTYFWRVRATTGGGSGEFTGAWSFATISAIPGAPLLVSPPDNSTGQPTTVEVQWNGVPGALTYRLQVGTDSTFAFGVILDDSTIADSSRILSGLSNGKTYWWHVNAKNLSGTGFWSSVRRFSTTTEVTSQYAIAGDWNMVSLPLSVNDPRKVAVFPTSTSEAFGFGPATGYVVEDTLRNGTGYWLKFDSSQTVSLTGNLRSEDTVEVQEGWNIIGSITFALDTGSVVKVPEGIVGSAYYGYSGGGYFPSAVVEPAKAYWVKANSAGKLVFSSAFRKEAADAEKKNSQTGGAPRSADAKNP